MEKSQEFRRVGEIEGQALYKEKRLSSYGRPFAVSFPEALLSISRNISRNDIRVLLAILCYARQENVCITSIDKISERLQLNGPKIAKNHISSHIRSLEVVGALKVVESSKNEIIIEISHEIFWIGNAQSYQEKLQRSRNKLDLININA